MASDESERNFEQYLQGVEFPATKDEILSAARSNDAPQHLIEHLEGLRDGAEFRDINELLPRPTRSRQRNNARVRRED